MTKEMKCQAAERIEFLENEIEELKEKLDQANGDQKEVDDLQRRKLEKLDELVEYLDQNCACERAMKLVEEIQMLDRMEYTREYSAGVREVTGKGAATT